MRIANFSPHYNNKVSSVRLTGDMCYFALFDHANGKGKRLTLSSPGLYNPRGSDDDMVSSYTVMRRRGNIGRRLDQAVEGKFAEADFEELLENDGWALEEVPEEMDQYDSNSALTIHADNFDDDELE